MKKVFQIKLKSLTRVFAMVMALSLVTFTGCKSYDSDIDQLNADLLGLKTDMTTLNNETKTTLTNLITTTQNALTLQINGLTTEINALKARLTTMEQNGATKAELEAVKTEILNKTVSLTAFNTYKDQVAAQLKNLQDQVDLAATKAQLALLQEQLNKAATKVELAEAKTELDGKIAVVAKDLADLTAKVTTLEANGATKAELAALKAEIELKYVLKADFEATKLAVEGMLKGLQDQINLLATKAEVKLLADRLDAKIVEIETTLVGLGAKVTKLEGDLVDTNTKLNNLGELVDAAIKRLDAKDVELANLIAGVNTRLLLVESILDIKDGKSVVIEDIKSQLTTQLGLINANTTKITKLEGDLLELSGKLTTLQAKVDANTLAIEANADAIEENTKAIEEINDELDKLRTELALINANMKVMADAIHLNFDALSNRLTSLTFVPEFFVNGIEAMNFSPLTAECLTITPKVTVAYHLNPSFIKLADIESDNMSFVLINSKHTVTWNYGAANAATVEVKATLNPEMKISNGKIYVDVSVDDLETLFATAGGMFTSPNTYEETFPMIALQIPLSEKAVTENKLTFDEEDGTVTVNGVVYETDRVITAEYVRLNFNQLVAMEDVVLGLNDTPADTYPLLVTTAADAKALTAEGYDLAPVTSPTVVFLPYEGTINLADTVAAILNGNSLFDVEKYGLKFKFDLLDESGEVIEYLRNGVDQQQFISITDPAKGTVTAADFPNLVDSIAKSVGRTPIVRVWMYNDEAPDCVMLYGFVKVVFEEQPDINLEYPFETSVASCDTTNWTIPVQWHLENVYDQAGMTSAEFHDAYSPWWEAEAGKVTRHGNLANNSTLNWSITPQEVWTKLNANPTAASVTFTATFKYTAHNQIVNPDFVITLTKTFTRPVDAAKQAILASELVAKYWYDLNGQNNGTVFEEVKSNVHVPAVGENTTANNKYETNLTGAFLSDADKSLMGYDNYQFFFVKDQKTHTINDGQTPATITLVPDATGQLLQYGGQTVATINPFATNVGDLIVLNNSSALAKRLLNYDREFLRATLGVRYDYCPDLVNAQGQKMPTTMPVTVDGKESFDVVFVRPLSANGVSGKKFIDGVLFGQTGSYMTIKDLAGLVDWRGTSFTSASHLYGYYGVTAIAVDIAAITTNVNGTWENLSAYPQLEVAVAPSVTGVTPVDPMGYLTYRNNGMTIGTDFQLKVPVTVTHHWGDIKTAIVTVNVEKTIGPSGVIRK